MTPQAGLFLSCHRLCRPAFPAFASASCAARPGGSARTRFQVLYSLLSLLTFGLMIYFYRAIGREPHGLELRANGSGSPARS